MGENRSIDELFLKDLGRTEWSTWTYTSAAFYCNLDDLWTGRMTYSSPTFRKEHLHDYTMYSLEYA